jgi:tetratricopeptide (TPR) repeat protein
VTLLSSGLGDEHQAAEWIHKAYEFGRRSQFRNPLLGLVIPLERMLREPETVLSAWEASLSSADPWVHAIARLQLGKMRIALGQGEREADAYLETALTEFRALGERFGISFALTELAERIATRGEFAAACENYEQAITVVAEVGAIDDVIRMRSRQAQLYWLLGDKDSSAAALVEAERCAERVTWPDALATLALSKAELARGKGDAEEAYEQLGVATTLWGKEAAQAGIRVRTQDLLGYLADDLDKAREHRDAAYRAAVESGHALAIAQVLVGVADLALRRDHYEQAARLLAASTAVRGLPDRANPDMARIEQAARSRLGDVGFAEAAREGTETNWSELVAVTLAS